MDFILRQQLTSDELPPWAGIVFKYPVDSDTLSEKLREAYPDCKTLRERKHRAAIDFLSAELSRMQAGNSNTDAICLDNFRFPAQEPAPDASKSLATDKKMAKDQGPWSTYATRNPSETALPDYVLDPDVTHSLSSPQTPVYGFQPDLTFYEGQWDPRQNQPSEYPPPG
ncbi:hypothetical protein SLS60_003095 [Paraconiothyrium brasiliense]|uniref:Uncharacterized protein n=1 Tax=Paraconiothyrium brasiliense TaxID=300254 RepID=A0ABR3RUP5_9PLEO